MSAAVVSLNSAGYNGFHWWVVIMENASKHLWERLKHFLPHNPPFRCWIRINTMFQTGIVWMEKDKYTTSVSRYHSPWRSTAPPQVVCFSYGWQFSDVSVVPNSQLSMVCFIITFSFHLGDTSLCVPMRQWRIMCGFLFLGCKTPKIVISVGVLPALLMPQMKQVMKSGQKEAPG